MARAWSHCARRQGSEAVFLDSWLLPGWMEGRTLAEIRCDLEAELEDDADVWMALYTTCQPAYTLYCVDADGRREDVSAPHETPDRDESGDYRTPPPSLREMLPSELRSGFSSTVCGSHPQHNLVEVSPKGGTLVIFESAVVPHEATPVIEGQRMALFGFFAEEKQVPRAWADPAGETSSCGPWFHIGWAHLDDERDIYDTDDEDVLFHE
uniref:Prolyl 4-hydroxylase alpha subunit Fe(2+) 2OG dioxygenase domain-containing protein n=1 Tax=Haptolina brevifila TaxID=156173 RepID=A0A7S2HXP1_9EUKA